MFSEVCVCSGRAPSPSHNTSNHWSLVPSGGGVPQWLVPGPFWGVTPVTSSGRGVPPARTGGTSLGWSGYQQIQGANHGKGHRQNFNCTIDTYPARPMLAPHTQLTSFHWLEILLPMICPLSVLYPQPGLGYHLSHDGVPPWS